jgi:hypothetical protein
MRLFRMAEYLIKKPPVPTKPVTVILTLSWPAGHTCPTYKEFFQVRWDNSVPRFLHATIYLEVYLFR